MALVVYQDNHSLVSAPEASNALVPALTPEQSQAVVIFQRVLEEKEGLRSENEDLKILVLKAHNTLITKHLRELFRIAQLEPGIRESVKEIIQDPKIEDAAKPHLIVKVISDQMDKKVVELSPEDSDFVDLHYQPSPELRDAFNRYRDVLNKLKECLFPELTTKQGEKALAEFGYAVAKDPNKLKEVSSSNSIAWALLGGVATVGGVTFLGVHLAFQSALKTVETACKVVETAVAVIVAIPTAAYAVYTLVSTIKKDQKT